MFRSTEPVRLPERFDDRAGDGQADAPLDVGEGDLRLEARGLLAARILGFESDLPGRLFVGRMRGVRLRLALGVLRLQTGDQVFEGSRLFGEIGRTLLLRAERVLGRRQGLLPRVNEFGEARLLESQ